MLMAERDEVIFTAKIISIFLEIRKIHMTKRIAILGAGPVGLAAAVHVLERNMAPLIIEQGSQVATAVRAWGHVPMLSNWRFNIDAAAARLLEREGWQKPDPDIHPNGADLINGYLDPLGPSLEVWLQLGQAVLAVSRDGIDKVKDPVRRAAAFNIKTAGPNGPEAFRSDTLIDATGNFVPA